MKTTKPFIDSPIHLIGKKLFDKSLRRTGPVNTFRRLFTSNHVRDLQWIASYTLIFYLLCVGTLFAVFFFWHRTDLSEFIFTCIAGITGAMAATLTWVYQTGSNRLGMVDLFGCEISVICRVCLVVDFANASVAMPHQAIGNKPKKFTSEENYTPVYDGTLSNLQALDADVVTYVTEFYTYRKTMMDYLRQIADGEIGSKGWARNRSCR